MSGHTRQNRIRNEFLKEKFGVVLLIVEKMIESPFRYNMGMCGEDPQKHW
jgi:hypothetical protein